jgi:hypothetical protein
LPLATQRQYVTQALRQRAVSVEDAMAWAADEGIIDLLKFGPRSKTGAAR